MIAYDPYYETGPAAWMRERAEDHGVHVELDYDLHFAGYARPDRSTIVARPGLELPTFLWLVASGVIAQRFGFEAAPDLAIGSGSVRRGRLHLISGGAG